MASGSVNIILGPHNYDYKTSVSTQFIANDPLSCSWEFLMSKEDYNRCIHTTDVSYTDKQGVSTSAAAFHFETLYSATVSLQQGIDLIGDEFDGKPLVSASLYNQKSTIPSGQATFVIDQAFVSAARDSATNKQVAYSSLFNPYRYYDLSSDTSYFEDALEFGQVGVFQPWLNYRTPDLLLSGNVRANKLSMTSSYIDLSPGPADNQLTVDHISLYSLRAKNTQHINSPSIEINTIVDFINDGLLAADHVSIVAGGTVLNSGDIEADSLEVSSENFLNIGYIDIENSSYIHAEKNITNQFGGVIGAKTIALVSPLGKVLNGSRCAHQFFLSAVISDSISSSQKNNNVVFSSGIGSGTSCDSLSGGGTNGLVRVPAEDYESVLVADVIEIKAATISNINPYFKLLSANSSYTFDQDRRDAVVMSAAKSLWINGTERVLNSSASMESVDGVMVIDSPDMRNERYKVQVDVLPGQRLPSGYCRQSGNCSSLAGNQSSSHSIDEQFISYLAPAGRIYSWANMILKGNGSFVNELSFVEVYGDLNVQVSNVIQTGLSLQNKFNETVTTYHKKRYCKRRVLGACVKRRTKRWQTYDYNVAYEPGRELSTLLYVENFLVGQGSGLFKSHTITPGF